MHNVFLAFSIIEKISTTVVQPKIVFRQAGLVVTTPSKLQMFQIAHYRLRTTVPVSHLQMRRLELQPLL